jgi:outer membrane protein
VLSRIRNNLLAGAATALLSLSSGTAAWAETLAEALTHAYMHSGLLEQNRATLRAADEDVAQAFAELRPVLSWAGGVQRSYGISRSTLMPSYTGAANNTANISLSLQQVIYAGGRNRMAIAVAKEAVLATRATLVSVEQQVLYDAVSAFMEIRRSAETVALRQNNIRVIRQELRAARDRFDVGEVTRTDVALAEARLAEAEAAFAAAQGNLVIAGEAYLAAVGRKPGNLQSPAGSPRIPATVEEAQALALRQHPSLISAQHDVTAREISIDIAKAAKKPTVTASAGYEITENFDTIDSSRGGTLRIGASGPIYSGGALDSAVRQAVAQRDASRANLHVVSHTVRQNVGNAYAQLRVARATVQSFEQQVRAAQVAFRGVREEAALGARTTLDVLDAEQELLDARASLISAQVDETIAEYLVLGTIGSLTAEALRLDVPRFDPSAYYSMVKSAPIARSKQGQELDRVLRALGKD